jgi:hypothetical protein
VNTRIETTLSRIAKSATTPSCRTDVAAGGELAGGHRSDATARVELVAEERYPPASASDAVAVRGSIVTVVLGHPGLNDSEAELDALTRWVVERLGPDVPLHFGAFHPDWKLRDRLPTPPATLARARRIAVANGVRYAYTGNVSGPEGQSTWCHSCGAFLIERDWYHLGAWNLTEDGRCAGSLRPDRGRQGIAGLSGDERLRQSAPACPVRNWASASSRNDAHEPRPARHRGANAFAAARPPKPPPMITTRGRAVIGSGTP